MHDNNLIFPAVFKRDSTGFYVSFPDLDGCFTEGETVVKAFINAREALALCLHGLEAVPKPSSIESIRKFDGEYIMLVSPDEKVNIDIIK